MGSIYTWTMIIAQKPYCILYAESKKIEDLVRQKGAGIHLNPRREKVMNSDYGDDGYGLVVPIKPPPPSD